MIQLDGDIEETGRNRLKIYHPQTQPLIDYYEAWSATGDLRAPKCLKISGVGSVEQIKLAAFDALN